jgi:hypothetical protein
MTSFPSGRDDRELTPSRAGAKTPYEFLVSHAKVIERLVPDERRGVLRFAPQAPPRPESRTALGDWASGSCCDASRLGTKDRVVAWPRVSGER